MLRLNKIIKTYKVADTNVEALKGIDLSFRANEFVSVLGPSGCGKTTLLNIIGGLDKYTSGDLFINGKSTKEFDDRHWDVYRNHRVGFIFQSYNLIPHQTILGNVELALTIAGLSKEERIEKAKKAIDRVGLEGQYYKKPNQLSGGQCQRVAIARALVNEPEILLADEPTGALDTVTSVQIMDLIKEISNEKLVIMVTHNPDLAEKYSTRIVKLLDGNVLEDSNPFTEEDEIAECEAIALKKKEDKELKSSQGLLTEDEVVEKAKMSFRTAFKLSFRNLLSKYKRTIMTVVAGSIGIVGVATVLSVSNGVKGYIKDMQDDMLSGNPIQVQKTSIDMEAVMNSNSFAERLESTVTDGFVNVNSMVNYFMKNTQVLESMLVQNEINKDYIDYVMSMPEEYYNAIDLQYGIDLTYNVFTDFNDSNTQTAEQTSLFNLTNVYTAILEETEEYKEYAKVITSLEDVLKQGVSDNDYISLQYDLVDGNLPKNANDVLIVLDHESSLTDLLLAQLGYYTQDEFMTLIKEVTKEEENYTPKFKDKFSYKELRQKEFVWYPNDYVFESENGVQFNYNHNVKDSFEIGNNDYSKGVKLNICGIVKPKDTVSYGSLKNGFIYSQKFAENVINASRESKVVKRLEQGSFTTLKQNGTISNMLPTTFTYEFEYFNEGVVKTKKEAVGKMSTASMFSSMMGGGMMGGNTGGQTVSSEYYILDLVSVGGSNEPTLINIYPLSFEEKYLVTEYLDDWNDISKTVKYNEYDENWNVVGTKTLGGKDELRKQIKYDDNVELIINMINDMIDIITYALVAFTALSLVVSTVMVGIITYVSVVERTKEIGVIRSLGGRKKDVSHLFNAETFMIGLASGVFGIAVTCLISLVLNIILKAVANVHNICRPTTGIAISMIVISILLNLISGMIPAKGAAKRNPVDALRSE